MIGNRLRALLLLPVALLLMAATPLVDPAPIPVPAGLPLEGLEVLLLGLPSLVGRAVAAFLRDGQGRVCSGAAAGPEPARKALTEALHNLEFLLRHPGLAPPEPRTQRVFKRSQRPGHRAPWPLTALRDVRGSAK